MKTCEKIIILLLLTLIGMGVWGFFLLKDKVDYLYANITDIQVCLEQ